MTNTDYEYEYIEREPMTLATRQILAGILVGGIIGATAMLFLSPRSGEEMRAEIRDRAADLRERTAGTVKDTLEKVASTTSHLKGDMKDRSQHLKARGQDVLIEKLDVISDAIDAAKKVLKEI